MVVSQTLQFLSGIFCGLLVCPHDTRTALFQSTGSQEKAEQEVAHNYV